jgi:uncharacterized protein (DUF2147 family)
LVVLSASPQPAEILPAEGSKVKKVRRQWNGKSNRVRHQIKPTIKLTNMANYWVLEDGKVAASREGYSAAIIERDFIKTG